MIDGTIVGKHD